MSEWVFGDIVTKKTLYIVEEYLQLFGNILIK